MLFLLDSPYFFGSISTKLLQMAFFIFKMFHAYPSPGEIFCPVAFRTLRFISNICSTEQGEVLEQVLSAQLLLGLPDLMADMLKISGELDPQAAWQSKETV